MTRAAALLIPCLLAVAACSGSSSEAPEGDSPANNGDPSQPGSSDGTGDPSGGGDGTGPGGTTPDVDGGGTPAGPCDTTTTAAIQASFDKAVPDSVDAVALVKDPSCGSRYFTRGPSKYPETALHLIASNSKTYLASLILLLVEEGKISLEDPASKWIDKVPGKDAIKVRHLLNHTSGLYNYSNGTDYLLGASLKQKYTPQDLLKLSFSKKVTFPAGEAGKWEYSNTNYVALGVIVEKVTGQPVEKVLRERILTPIGAKATFFYGKEEIVGDIAPGKSFLGGNGATYMDPSAYWCAGQYVSTLGDLATWAEVRGNGTFHSAAAQAEMMKTVPTADPGMHYGAGIMVFDASATHGGGPAIGHGGDLVGYHSYGLYFPEKKTTIVVMQDGDQGPGGGFPSGPSYRSELFFSIVDPLFGYTPPADGGGK